MTMQETVYRDLLRFAVGHAITCPRCHRIMDVRTAVNATLTAPGKGDHSYTVCTACWDHVRLAMGDLARDLGGNLEVIDGRLLFPPTQAEVRKACKALGCVCKIVDGEYQVRIKAAPEVTTYYTEDGQDAIGTARAMAEQWARQQASKCRWFLKCTNPATGVQLHPVLGEVPICDRCRTRYNSQEAK